MTLLEDVGTLTPAFELHPSRSARDNAGLLQFRHLGEMLVIIEHRTCSQISVTSVDLTSHLTVGV